MVQWRWPNVWCILYRSSVESYELCQTVTDSYRVQTGLKVKMLKKNYWILRCFMFSGFVGHGHARSSWNRWLFIVGYIACYFCALASNGYNHFAVSGNRTGYECRVERFLSVRMASLVRVIHMSCIAWLSFKLTFPFNVHGIGWLRADLFIGAVSFSIKRWYATYHLARSYVSFGP